jgi:glutamate formiminotransferase
VHQDVHHNRAVLTLAGSDVETAARHVARTAVEHLDLRAHQGVHPRIGVVDVVPFVPLDGSTMDDALAARDRFAMWAADALALPCFLYGRERTLPDVRRQAFRGLAPDRGPGQPHPTAGACAVGARPLMLAYNLWLDDGTAEVARALAIAVRGEHVRALGLQVGDHVQVSMNLLAPFEVGPRDVYDIVGSSARIARAELVGLAPRALVEATPSRRWPELDLDEDRTIEARLEQLRSGA